MVKMTFTFDEQTVETLRRTASRMKKPQSVIVHEAHLWTLNPTGFKDIPDLKLLA